MRRYPAERRARQSYDWSLVARLAGQGFYAPEIAEAIGWRSSTGNLIAKAKENGVTIGRMPRDRVAKRRAILLGKPLPEAPIAPRPVTRPATLPPPCRNVWEQIRKMLEDTHAAS